LEEAMQPTPRDWPRISSGVFYEDAAAAIDFLVRAFGFEVRLKVEGEGGRIEHSELTYGEGLVSIGSLGKADREFCASPRQVGGVNTQCLCVYVDDVDAHCARAREAGAKIAAEPTTTDYGDDYWADRSYRAVDPEGHNWWFMHRMREKQGG
jgi:uncharacterized glyoxalase superfamily protein PhnB